MEDLDNQNSMIADITPETYKTLKARGIVAKGMIPKLDNAFNAIASGVGRVIIKHAANLCNDRGTVLMK